MAKKSNVGSLLASITEKSKAEKKSVDPSETIRQSDEEKRIVNPAIGLATGATVKRAQSVKEPVLHLEHDQVILFKYHDRHLSAIDTVKVAAMKESIADIGQQFPGVVRKTDKVTDDGRMIYELVCGRLRYESSKGIAPFKAFLRELDDQQAAMLMIIENEQRQDITPFERWLSVIPLVKDGILSARKIAELTKQDPGNFSRSLKAVDVYEDCTLGERLDDVMSVSMSPLIDIGIAYHDDRKEVAKAVEHVKTTYPQLMNNAFLKAIKKIINELKKPVVERVKLYGSKLTIKKDGDKVTLSFTGLPREEDFQAVIDKLKSMQATK